ncbi:PaaI family thioesterase [Litorimonas sp. RW-G-Af-16]|uniref:PaaI family thioesterase n=1 Tax=Litorimonas sp. RW-G-Af-16 TaxID=3241168 RepID=UPI00390C95EE
MIDQPAMQTLLKRIPYATVLGVEGVLIGKELTLKMPYKDSNVGNATLPALHGGGISGLMEIAAIAELIFTTQSSALPKPIGINVDYLRRGHPKDTYARAIVFKQGARVANVRVRAWQDDYDKPIATMHGHYLTAKRDA